MFTEVGQLSTGPPPSGAQKCCECAGNRTVTVVTHACDAVSVITAACDVPMNQQWCFLLCFQGESRENI